MWTCHSTAGLITRARLTGGARQLAPSLENVKRGDMEDGRSGLELPAPPLAAACLIHLNSNVQSPLATISRKGLGASYDRERSYSARLTYPTALHNDDV